MSKRIIFISVLVLFVAASVYFGLKPFGIFAEWQGQNITQEQKEAAAAQKREAEAEKKAAAAQKKEAAAEEQRDRPAKGIHVSLDEKSDQILKVWTSLETVHGAVVILQSIDTSGAYPGISPLVGLAPYEKALTRTSKLFQAALGILTFEKTLLILFISVAFLLLIPVCVLISVFKLWKQKDIKMLPRIVIVSVLFSLLILFALPLSIKIASLADEIVLSSHIANVISSIDKNVDSAVKTETTLRGVRRLGDSVLGHIASAKDFSGNVMINTVHFLVIFLITHIIIPVFVIIGLFKLAKYSEKLILKTK